MSSFITTDDLWRKWARDRDLYDPGTKGMVQLARDFYAASDADTDAARALHSVSRIPGAEPEQVVASSRDFNVARGRLMLVQEAIEQVGGSLDFNRSGAVVLDAAGCPIPRGTPADHPVHEVVRSRSPRPADHAVAAGAGVGRPVRAVGW